MREWASNASESTSKHISNAQASKKKKPVQNSKKRFARSPGKHVKWSEVRVLLARLATQQQIACKTVSAKSVSGCPGGTREAYKMS